MMNQLGIDHRRLTFRNNGIDRRLTDVHGELIREITLIGKQCTNIAFCGVDGRTAYVTMADRGNVETFRVEQPGREWQLAQRGKN